MNSVERQQVLPALICGAFRSDLWLSNGVGASFLKLRPQETLLKSEGNTRWGDQVSQRLLVVIFND